MEKDKILEFARKQGYDDVRYLGKWRSFDSYEPLFKGPGMAVVGPPLTILVQGNQIRMSTVEEAMDQIAEQ